MRSPDRPHEPATQRLDAAIETIRRAAALDPEALPALDDRQLQQLRCYLEVLLLWRQRTALIATADPIDLVEHHILDSLHVAPHLAASTRLADVGSGAGLPGVPLAIALPGLRVALLESRRRKANFLRAARRQVALQNVEIVEGRAEDVGEKFDAVVCRAVGPLGSFLDLVAGMLTPGGVAIAMKAPAAAAAAEPHSAFAAAEVVRYQLVGGRQRVLLLYRRL